MQPTGAEVHGSILISSVCKFSHARTGAPI
jgi:hypothetical protein